MFGNEPQLRPNQKIKFKKNNFTMEKFYNKKILTLVFVLLSFIAFGQTHCTFCLGSCKMNCDICFGQGGKYERVPYQRYDSNKGYSVTEYENKWVTCSAWGCNNGKKECKYCKCKSVGLSNSNYSTDKIPFEKDIFGKWKDKSGDIYTFYSTLSSEGNYILKCVSHGNDYLGEWTIEDNLFKIYFYTESKWRKHTFTSFTKNYMSLYYSEGFLYLYLTRMK